MYSYSLSITCKYMFSRAVHVHEGRKTACTTEMSAMNLTNKLSDNKYSL